MVIGRGQGPPLGIVGVDDPAARGDGGLDSGHGDLARDRYVDVHASSARLGRRQLVEPQMRTATLRIDRILLAEVLVPQCRRPEGPGVHARVLGHRDADHLQLSGLGGEAECSGRLADPRGEHRIRPAQSAIRPRGGADRHAVRPQVDVGVMADGCRGIGDRRHEA